MSLSKLKRLARKWGGDVVELSRSDYDKLQSGFYEAPFTSYRLGVHHRSKTVYWSEKVEVGEVIHEMGHVFASKRPPDLTEEWDFFGWEYILAKKVGALKEWTGSTSDYQVSEDGETFGGLTEAGRVVLLTERVSRAKALGLLSPRLSPLSIR